MKRYLLIIFFLVSTALAQRGTVQRFGIFSPVLGLREDVPAITMNEAFTEDNENVLMKYGEIHRAKMRLDTFLSDPCTGDPCAMPDGNPILKYHWYEKANGDDFLLAFTKAHAYHWETVRRIWDPCFVCGSDAEEWSVVTYTDIVYATNNVDKIQYWNGSGAFANLDSASGIDTGSGQYLTKAKWLVTFENYLLAGNVMVSGSSYPQDIYWSDTGDAATWDSGNAGSATVPGPDPLQGAAQLEDFLLVFTGRSIDALWAVNSTLIFNRRRYHNSLGTYSPGSIVRDSDEKLYFIDNHKNIRRITSVMAGIPKISLPVDETIKNIPDSELGDIRSTYIWDLDQLWWAIPYGPDATTNNKIMCLDIKGAWTKRDMAVSTFGVYENKVTYSWRTLPFDNWHDWGWDDWKTAEARADYRLDICGDYSGYSYVSHASELDSEDAYTGYAVLSTDFSQQKGGVSLLTYKRLLRMTLFFRRESAGTASISLKRDLEGSWQSVGNVTLSGDGEILWKTLDCDYRARHWLIKISGTNRFRFIGVIFDYVTEGMR